ncbi:hypothetical protein QR680_003908 [Steinernema hermaphroditum]|nr:hypothetical protein QR680_003908 [Steinernema hermaphroditum]
METLIDHCLITIARDLQVPLTVIPPRLRTRYTAFKSSLAMFQCLFGYSVDVKKVKFSLFPDARIDFEETLFNNPHLELLIAYIHEGVHFDKRRVFKKFPLEDKKRYYKEMMTYDDLLRINWTILTGGSFEMDSDDLYDALQVCLNEDSRTTLWDVLRSIQNPTADAIRHLRDQVIIAGLPDQPVRVAEYIAECFEEFIDSLPTE